MFNAVLVAGDGATTPNVVQRVYQYIPSRVAAGIAAACYLLASVGLFVRLIRRKDWWGLCLPIGALTTAIGFLCRIMLNDTSGLIVFILQQFFIVCSPAAFLAFDYIVYGRLIRLCIGREYSLIRPEIVARTFVISDVVTFFVQASGGGMEAVQNAALAKVGEKIFLVGLIAQAASYVLFTFLLLHVHVHISKSPTTFPRSQPWWRIVWVLYFSSVFIIIRSVYRVTELAQGYSGFLMTHEVYFYVLDTLPLFIAIVVYVPLWPGKYLAESSLPGAESTANGYKMVRPGGCA